MVFEKVEQEAGAAEAVGFARPAPDGATGGFFETAGATLWWGAYQYAQFYGTKLISGAETLWFFLALTREGQDVRL